MKTLRKALSLTLMLALVLTSAVSTSVFAQDIVFTDVDATTQYGDAIYELVADGVINGYDDQDGTKCFKPLATITRAEFSKVIGIALEGQNAIWDAKDTKFADVKGHWATPYVAYASTVGIINGYEDGTFRPDQPVTYAEAVKMIVCSLNYGSFVDKTLNPWYAGYLNIADRIGVTKNAAGLADRGAPRGLVAQLISNMKNAKKIEIAGTDENGKPIFEQTESDENEEEGVVLGVYDNTLRGAEIELTRSQINIDGDVYTLSDSLKERDDLGAYVGKRVTFTYEGTSKLTVTSIRLASGNETVEISLDQFDSVSGNKLYYYKNPDKDTKTSNYTLDDNLYVVYNGYGVESTYLTDEFIKSAFDIDAGSIVLYNNDNDNAMDVVIIENYKTYFLNSSAVNNKGVYTITDKNGYAPTITVDEDDATVYKVTTANGKPSAGQMSNLTSNSVVSVATPLNSKEGTIIKISTATVSGSVDEMASDYTDIKVGSKVYEISPYFKKLVTANPTLYGFSVGTNVTLYLDYLGRIVSSKVNTTSNPYGYLMDYATSGGSFDGNYQLKILTTGNSWITRELKSTVKVNGKSCSQDEALIALGESADFINGGKPSTFKKNARVAQLIKYKEVDYDGKKVISEISTITEKGDGEIDLSFFADCSEQLKYSKSGYSFANGSSKIQFTINSSTVVFAVPGDRASGDSEYKKAGYGYFSSGASYHVEAYDITSGTTAKVVVCYIGEGETSSYDKVTASTPSYIIKDITKTSYDGNECHKVTLLKMGTSDVESTTEVYTETTSVMSGYSVGDVVKYVATEDDVIADIVAIYSGGKLVGATNNHIKTTDEDTIYQAMLGTVYTSEIEGGAGTIGISPNFAKEVDGVYTLDEGAWKSFTVSSGTVYYELTEGRNSSEISLSSADAIVAALDTDDKGVASQIMIVVYNGAVKAVYLLGSAISK